MIFSIVSVSVDKAWKCLYVFCLVHLKERLEEYIKQWNGLVKLFRNEKREGLIQARSIGARKATLGQVWGTIINILFIDTT